jgi:chemotaxis protein MotB
VSPDEQRSEPIIIVRKKSSHGGHHGGSWKVAYADFVTSMMAFFLVMWLMVQSDVVRNNIAGYFQDPTGFKKGGSSSVLPEKGNSIIPMKQKDTMIKKLSQRQREEEMRKMLRKAGEEIQQKLKSTPGFKTFQKQVEVELTAEGLRIQLLDSEGQSFFEKGSAELLPKTKLLLKLVAQELAKLPNRVIIEGHTDSLRYAANAVYTNWELSADRANSARLWMEEHGLRRDQVSEVRGFAYTQPKIASNPGDPRNRRIAIIVVNDFSGMNYLDKNVVLDGEQELSSTEQDSEHSSKELAHQTSE